MGNHEEDAKNHAGASYVKREQMFHIRRRSLERFKTELIYHTENVRQSTTKLYSRSKNTDHV